MSAKVTIAKAGSPEDVSGGPLNAAIEVILKALDAAGISDLPPLHIVISSAIAKGEETVSPQSETEKILSKGFSIFKTAEERFVLGIVLEPTKELNKPDSQGDIYSADEVRTAADKFMEEYQQIGVQHKEMTKAVKILRNWITLEDCTINGQAVAKGTWLLGVRVQDDDLWSKVKKGEITAFSIGGKANREPVE